MCEVDAIFEALADERRRLALYYLQKHQTLTLPDLAELLVEHEHDVAANELPGERIRDVYFSFYHQHLPKLERIGLVRYDQEADRLTCTDRCSTALQTVRDEIERLEPA